VRSELAVPLVVKNRVIGVLDIESTHANHFTEEHKRLLTLIASRMAVGIENARLYTRITRQARTLLLLNEIARELTSILNLDELLKRVGELLSRLIDFQMFSILLLDRAGEKLEHRFSLRFQENIQLKHDIPIGKGIVGYAAEKRQGVLVRDVKKDPRYIATNPETRSELAVPLFYKDKVIGVLDLEHTRRAFFTEDHQRTITTLAAQIAIAIENARLYEEIARQERRLERDLAMARELQFRLLPQSCPQLAHLAVAAKFSPARAIGGDLYDFLSYSGSRTAMAIGDVSGKGAPAAIYAALVSGILRSHAPIEPGPAEMLAAINYSLAERRIDGQFVSLIYAVWNEHDRSLQVANSGLPRPVYCRRGKTRMIEATGLPLGLFADAEYDEFTFQAEPDDVFVFFSDGILDASNRAGELFGRARLERVVAESSAQSAASIVGSIFHAAAEHASGMDPFDDQTVVAIKVKGNAARRT
jgi:sigma-B regulation protein RsbU (phosphoserine phosphatase)